MHSCFFIRSPLTLTSHKHKNFEYSATSSAALHFQLCTKEKQANTIMIILRKQGSTTSSTTACSFALFTGVIVILLAFWTDALVPIIRSSRLLFAASATQLCSTPSPEQAKEMMELLIKANEEKKQAVAETEAKYQAIIEVRTTSKF